jgi:rhodanese-related sulfurtransferase
MKHITVSAFQEVVRAESGNTSVDFINVCTPVEWNEKHIAGVRNVPLDTLASRKAEFDGKSTIYVHCRSGARSQRAIGILKDMGITAELVNVEGGLLAWEGAGLPTGTGARVKLPLMRQVMLTAGLLIVVAFALGHLVDPRALYLALFVGLGLTISGLTGWCGMALLLGRMPWNK